MPIIVERVTPDRIGWFDVRYVEMQAAFSPTVKSCLAGPDYPELDWLHACIREDPPSHDIAVATDDGVFVGLIVVWLPESRIIWQVFNAPYVLTDEEHRHDAIWAFTTWTLARYGVSYGSVENPVVRQVMTDLHPRIVEVEHQTGILIQFDAEL